ncbi:uncharacterized protein B0J16DRAFT_335705 [Fusarium flagelliforme]|uniref:uncharacterized protein n=1 Tax=Fusarium flagelliforme TaxID=2675880 RepID=UPI001E8DFAB5|nr:uncharacterized protein B0J16DRAFT_335705 [Fusarium flagelliforme]KAH7193640.1 hypothetical protein B0J16DRAFT_335705 [Fusarium flagelliforme]
MTWSVTTFTPAFIGAEFRDTLHLSRSRAILVVISNRGNFIGYEVNEITKAGALELPHIYNHIARLNVKPTPSSCFSPTPRRSNAWRIRR